MAWNDHYLSFSAPYPPQARHPYFDMRSFFKWRTILAHRHRLHQVCLEVSRGKKWRCVCELGSYQSLDTQGWGGIIPLMRSLATTINACRPCPSAWHYLASCSAFCCLCYQSRQCRCFILYPMELQVSYRWRTSMSMGGKRLLTLLNETGRFDMIQNSIILGHTESCNSIYV